MLPSTSASTVPLTSTREKKENLGAPMFFLALMITSLFYCLPLGRFSFGGYSSDFRIYDFVFIIFLLFVGRNQVSKIPRLARQRSQFHVYALILIVIVVFSLLLTWATRDTSEMLPVLIRVYRFIMYFSVGSISFAILDLPRRQRFALGVFYANVIVQAVLAFLQSLNWLPTFWPSYWLVQYGVFPVGTLSPHHLQIGIVMLIGIALSMTYFRRSGNFLVKFLLSLLISCMIVVAIKAEIRTAWFALVGWFIAFIIVHRRKAIWPILLLIAGMFISFQFIGETTFSSMQEVIERRLLERVEESGLEGVLGERFAIYESDPLSLLQSKPWIVLVGAGFQNVSIVLGGATGAHNNYLQVFFEIGIFGFIIYMLLLLSILGMLWKIKKKVTNEFPGVLAGDVWALFIAIMISMFAGETLWAQYSAFTLPGQIMMIVAIASSPLNWLLSEKTRIHHGSTHA